MNSEIGKHYECLLSGKKAKDCKWLKSWQIGDKLRVIAYVDMNGHSEQVPVFWNENQQQASTLNPDFCRPWKTEEEIEIEKMKEIVSDCYNEAKGRPYGDLPDDDWDEYLKALYDAGCRMNETV